MPQNPDNNEERDNLAVSAVPTKRKAEHSDDDDPSPKRKQSEFIKSILKQGPSTKSERVAFAPKHQEKILDPDLDGDNKASRISDDFRINSQRQLIVMELEKIYSQEGNEAVKNPKFQSLNQLYHKIEQHLVAQSGLSKDEYRLQEKESEKYAAGMREESRAQWKSASYDRNAKVEVANVDLRKEGNEISKDAQKEPTFREKLLAKIARDEATAKSGFKR